ncbi:MAG: secreted protein containing Cellulosome anchoring protein, cohesin region domain protein [Candidatus Syntrophoarchaeum caldarius]|uniref:Secreted protein containing Cellulosome anchoring protein, cohesin region domain protein n=1 Tax=Candidatus Syntropharchaeum caldarium TaxID=1838285 RepID=A0A1F2PAB8_9EURY|nr:MAG: secreted protein containing Cellulosome anchoring protein, cohesin region domain protein [Candidatus Syntrophoarchaeum caldarius]
MMRHKLAASVVAILIVASALVITAAANEETVISIEDVAAGKGESVTVPIIIKNLDGGLGANIILNFDPDVVQVLDIDGSDFNFPVYSQIDNEAGYVQYAAFNFPTSLTGDVVFAEVTFEAVGEGGDTSPLDLTVTSLTDGMDEITHTVVDGTFTVLDTIVSIENLSCEAGETTTVPIMIENLYQGLGANIILNFDPDVVQVLDVADGEFNFPLYRDINNSAGSIQYTALNFPTSLTGDVVFAQITFEAVGAIGDTSPLDLTVISLTDGVDEITHRVVDGTFTIEAGDAVPKVVVNEFLSDPLPGDSEWIELYNLMDEDISLDDWTIEDNTASPASLNGKTIPANGFLLLNKSTDFSFGLNNGGDTIILKNGGNVIDRVTYGDFDDGDVSDNAEAPEDGASAGRYPDGMDTDVDSNDFAIFENTTPGGANTPPQQIF